MQCQHPPGCPKKVDKKEISVLLPSYLPVRVICLLHNRSSYQSPSKFQVCPEAPPKRTTSPSDRQVISIARTLPLCALRSRECGSPALCTFVSTAMCFVAAKARRSDSGINETGREWGNRRRQEHAQRLLNHLMNSSDPKPIVFVLGSGFLSALICSGVSKFPTGPARK